MACDRIKTLMTGFGFNELITYSFVRRDCSSQLNLGPDDPRQSLLKILNPLSEDQAVMRTSLIPGLLMTLHRNLAKQNRNIKGFEVGKIFMSKGQDHLPEEIEMVAAIWSGTRVDLSWHAKETDCDFYDIKGAVESLLAGLQIPEVRFTHAVEDAVGFLRPGYCARIFSGNRFLGVVGEVSPAVLANFDLKQKSYVFEMNVADLCAAIPQSKQARPLPKYPAIDRDITLIVDRHLEAERILAAIREAGEELVENLFIFDIFTGSPIPAGKKSVSLRVIYRSAHKTLEDETVNQIHRNITARLLGIFQAALPA